MPALILIGDGAGSVVFVVLLAAVLVLGPVLVGLIWRLWDRSRG